MDNETSQSRKSAKAIFDGAIDLPLEQRAAFLEAACASDAPLCLRVEALLRAYEAAGSFMDKPAVAPSPDAGHPALTDQSGRRIGRYKLLQQIGEGGCGVVYMAEQAEPVRRQVALKVIKVGMDTKTVMARFEAERQALAMMDHPNIAKVLDAGATDHGRLYFVMELVRGVKITDYCDKCQLPTAQRLQLFILVCRGIQHAHQKGIIHRDIKPSNILVTDHDGVAVPKIIDFGIAKATAGHPLTDKTLFTAFEQFLGTPAYMSPEQAKLSGLDIDTRSDVYSLGVLLYELLTGKTPFEHQRLVEAGVDEIRRIIREEDPMRPSTKLRAMEPSEQTTRAQLRQTEPPKLVHLLRGDLDWIVMKALEKDRARRYETANDLAQDIERHLHGDPIVARPASAAYRFQKMIQRNKLLFFSSFAVLAALIIGLGVSTVSVIRTRRALRQAVASEQRAELNTLRAESAETKAKKTLAASDFSQAALLIAADDNPDAVAYLLRILSADPENGMALTRLATLLTYQTWMMPVLSLEHGDSVSFAQFSPDGRRIVTASWDHTARVWDAQTGQPLTEPLQHEGMVESARFSADGRRIVTASTDKTARVWDAQTGQPLTGPLRHNDRVVCAQFSPDGRRIVTASWDHTARVWDAQSGHPMAEPLQHEGMVESAQFSADGRRIVTASTDKTARVWDAQTGHLLTGPLRHNDRVTCAQFSPDGQRIVTSSADWTARVWDAKTGQPLTERLQHEGWVTCAQFSPDGQRIVTTSGDNTARIWDAQTGQLLGRPLQHGSGVDSAQFSLDSKRVVTASSDNTVRLWDAQSGQALTEPLNVGSHVNSAQFSPDGRRIVIAFAGNVAQIWDAQAGHALAEHLPHKAATVSARFSPDSRRIVTASLDGTARVWDAQTGRPLTEPLLQRGEVMSAQFSPDGARLVTGSVDQTAWIWDSQTGQTLIEPLRHEGSVICAQFSPDGQRILTASQDATARVWDAQTGRPLTNPLQHKGDVTCAQFSPDGARIVTASADNTARVWDAQTSRLLTTPLRHQDRVNSAQFSPEGRYIVTASDDNAARVWDAMTGKMLNKPLTHGGRVGTAQFSPDGKRVVTASNDHTARIWDAQTGQPLTSPLKHARAVMFAQFSSDGRRVVTASWDNTARVWDAQTGQPLTSPLQHGNQLNYVQFSPDGRRIVTVAGTAAWVWDVGFVPSKCPAWLLRLAEAIGGKRLNQQGVLEQTGLDRAKTVAQIRQDLNHQPENGDGVLWGRWLLADPSTRTISPLSRLTLPEYIENDIAQCIDKSLEEAAQLASGNVELLQRILKKRSLLKGNARLQDEAGKLAVQGDLVQAEARYHEALRSNREVWADEYAKWERTIDGLVDVLRRERKFDEAEKVFHDTLAPGFTPQPPDAAFLKDRAFFLAWRGQWKDAAADFSRLVDLNPGSHWPFIFLVTLLAHNADLEGYRHYCAQAMAHFGTTDDPLVAERVCKGCLILPSAGVDLNAVARLANIAATNDPSHKDLADGQFAKGLAEYRQGHFASAADWAGKALVYSGQHDERDAQAYLVLAMAQHQSSHVDESLVALAKAAQIIETKTPKLENGDLGTRWHEWLIAQLLLHEAKALMEPVAAPGH